MDGIERRVIELIGKRLSIDPQQISSEMKFGTDMGLSVLDQIDLLTTVEDEFDVDFDGDPTRQVKTVDQLIDFVRSSIPSDDSLSRRIEEFVNTYCDIKVARDRVKVKFRSDWLHNQAELKEAMLRIDECAAGQETPDVELDMCEVAHVSSHALGWFLDSARRVAERDGRMHIINAGTPLYSTLSVVQLNEICEIDVPSELETAK